ncbi:MAG: DUF3426 domain-containing protein [Parvibaculum sp.]|nr:DUF3426 domain-containing protein [Parvibaculum sp.]
MPRPNKTASYRMIITCPSCSARYPVDASSFAPAGRKVRCAKCGNTWHQAPPSELGGAADTDIAVESSVPLSVVQSQKPLFNNGQAAKAKSVDAPPAAVAVAPSAVVAAKADDPFDDNDIMFAPAESTVAPKAEETVPDTPVRFYDVVASSSVQAETGGKLRRYLNDVASMRRGRVFGAIGWVLLVLFVAGTIFSVVQYRREIAIFWPSTIELYEAAGAEINLVGFELSQVSYERQDENGLPVLAIKGEVVNISGETKRVPRIRVGLRDENQQELYHWTFALPESELKPDAKAVFTTRLSSPPAGARDLEVRFVEPDEEAGEPEAALAGDAPAEEETPAPEMHDVVPGITPEEHAPVPEEPTHEAPAP